MAAPTSRRPFSSRAELGYTLVLGSDTVDELAQEDYYGYSGSYFSVQGLVNTGNAGRLPKVAAYTVIVVVYLLLIGPGIYHLSLYRRKGYHWYEDKDGKFEGAFVEVEDDGHLILHDKKGVIRSYASRSDTYCNAFSFW